MKNIVFSVLFFAPAFLFAQKDQIPFSKIWKDKIEKKETQNLQIGRFYELEAQFQKVLTSDQKRELTKIGVQLLDYKNNLTYRIGLPVDLDLTKLDHFPIRNLKKIDANTKIDEIFFGKAKNTSSKVEILLSKNAQITIFLKKIQQYKPQNTEIQAYFNIVSCQISTNQIQEIAQFPEVVFISQIPENQLLNEWGNTQVRGSTLLEGYRKLDGSGVRIANFDLTNPFLHLDFAPRITRAEILGVDNHSTGNVGIIGGTGAIDPYKKGIAPKTEFVSYQFSFVPYKMAQAIQTYGVSLSNNPYGPSVICSKPYSFTNHLEDRIAYDFPNVTHIFAAGNSQSTCGAWNNVVNIAKNTIIVGGTNIADLLTGIDAGTTTVGASSVGTSQDGRIIPHLAALGIGVQQTAVSNGYWSSGLGTSQACPQITGIAAQTLQRYRQLFKTDPPSSLIKAVLCNTAQDLGNPYPDYRTGFGRPDALKAVRTFEQNRFRINKIQTAQNQSLTINIPQGASKVKVMIVWTDPPANMGANPTLVNDLNLKLTHTSSGTVYNAWVLNPALPNNVATRGIDNRNNIEQITIDNPIGGTYQIDIQGFNIALGTEQEYALVWEIEEPHLEITFPNGGETLLSGGTHYIRWNQSANISGTLTFDYSLDNGNTWNFAAISNSSVATWVLPANTFSNQVRLRVRNGGMSDISDEVFTLAPQPVIASIVAGNNQLTLNWNAVTGSTEYKVYLYDQEKEIWNLVGNNITGTSHTITGLQNGITYWLTVRCQNAAGVLGERAYASSGIPTGAGTATDLQVIDIQNLTNWTSSNSRPSNEFISIQIRNNGTTILTAGIPIPVSYQIDNQAVINENFTTANINPSDVFTYSFAAPANLSTYKEYFISASVNLLTDFVSINNSFAKKLINKPLLKIIAEKTNPCGTTLHADFANNLQNYSISAIPLAMENMTTVIAVSVPDNQISDAFPIGFKFNFFGEIYDKFFISNDGFILFDALGTKNFSSWDPQTLPNTAFPNNLVALSWADTDPSLGGTIKYQTIGTSPNRKLVVEFSSIRYFGSTNSITGQIILYENTNHIELHNQNVLNHPANTQTQGIENQAGTQAFTVVGRNRTNWNSVNEAFRFTPDPATWLWNTAETTASIYPTTTGSYSITYTQGTNIYTAFATVTNACGTPPTITQIFPADNAINASISSTFEIIFDKNIRADLGFLTISNASQTFFISAGDLEKVQIKENKVQIKTPFWLEGNSTFFVKINPNAFKDFEAIPNFFAGILNTTDWNFQTENQIPQDISLISRALAENSPIGTLVGNLHTTDPDGQQNHTYMITGGTGIAVFNIVGNLIYTNATLNYTINPSYTLEITSTDNGTPSKSFKKWFNISVHQFEQTIIFPKNIVLCAAGNAFLQVQANSAGTWQFLTTFSEIPSLPIFSSANATFTQVSNLQPNTSYQFTFRNDNLRNDRLPDPNVTVMITVLGNAPIAASTEKNWIGAANTSFYDCRNWADQNIPFLTSNIHITNSAINQPLLYSPFFCQNLFISTGQNLDIQPFITVKVLNDLVINGTLKIEPNAHVFVTGNMTNNGNFDLKGNAYLVSNYLNNSALNLTNGTLHFVSSSTSQILGTVQPNFFNLVLNKPNSLLMLAQKTGISGNLQFITGKIQSSVTNFLIFQDNASHSLSNDYSFVEGKVQKIGNDPFVFPIGKNNRFAPAELVVLSNTDVQDHFTAEYFDTGFGTLITAESKTYEVKNVEYWQIDRGGVANTTQAQIRLSWKNHSGLAFGTATDLAVGRWTGTGWISEGQGAISGLLNGSGSVSSIGFVTAFSPFTFVFQTVISPPNPPVVTPTQPVSAPIIFYPDLSILWIAYPLQDACNQPLTKNESIKIRFRNTGNLGLSVGTMIPITYLEGSTAHTENWILPSFWQVGQEMDFAFARKFDFSERRNYHFTVKLNYLADQNPINNELKQTINIKPAFQILASKPSLACQETVELRATNFPEGSKLVWEQNGKVLPFTNYFLTTSINSSYSVRYENGNCTEKAIFELKETCLPVLEKVLYNNSQGTITLTFSEAIQKGQGIIRLTNGTEEIIIDLNGLKIDNQTITINLQTALQPNSRYTLGFETSNFVDLQGNYLNENSTKQDWTFPSNQNPKDLIFCPKVLGKSLKITLSLIDDFAPNPIFSILSSNIPNLKIEKGEIVGDFGTAEHLEIEVEGRDNGLPSLPIRKKISLQVIDYQVLDAGADQVICAGGNAFLQADERNNLGKGEWILANVSPMVSVLPRIENRFSAFTQVADLQANTNYEFVWKNQNFGNFCSVLEKEKVQITVLNQSQVTENQTVHWIGSQNYSWFDCRNWEERQIPNFRKNVVIKNDIPYPVFASEIVLSCQNLTINPKQSLLLDESVLQVHGNLQNRGYLFSPPNGAGGSIEIGENLEQEGFLAQKNLLFFGAKESYIFGKKGLEVENLKLQKAQNNLQIETFTTISGSLVLEKGKIQITENQVIMISEKGKIVFSERNFVLGKITKMGKTNFAFPVGVGERLLKLEITDLENATDKTQITVSFVAQKPENEKLSDPITKISLKGFWRVECADPKVSGTVKVFWDKEMTDSINIEPEKLVLAKFENGTWVKVDGKTGVNASFAVASVSELYKTKLPLATENSVLETQSFKVVPNPLEQNEIGIWLYSPKNQKVSIDVFDILGRKIENFEAQLQSGENRLRLVPKNELGKGIYQIQIKEWGKTQKIWR